MLKASTKEAIMQLTHSSTATMAVGAALAVATLVLLVWRVRVRRLNGASLQARYRRDVRGIRLGAIRVAERRSNDVWSAGAAPDSPHSKKKKAVAYVAMASTGGCGGCGGCGCGG
jgi:hypothetical protein